MAEETILDTFDRRVREHPRKVALRHKRDGIWREVDWAHYGDAVRRVGKGLLGLGFRRGDRMALLASNRPEWFFADIGCMSVGGVTSPVYVTSSPQQVAHVIGHSGSKVAVVESTEQLDNVLGARSRLPDLETVVVLDGDIGDAPPGTAMRWADLVASSGVAEDRFEERRASLAPEDVATLVYTSGTGGEPKAVMLTHRNVRWTCDALERHLLIEDAAHGRALSYLPLSHIAERMVSHFLQISFGSETWFARSTDSLRDDLQSCRPTYFFGVPRVWEKFHDAIQARIEQHPRGLKRRAQVLALRRAVTVGAKIARAEQEAVAAGATMSRARVARPVRLEHALLDRLVLVKLRDQAGFGECKRTFSAAAPLRADLVWFWHSIGIKVAEGYGQSETTGPTTWNPPSAIRIGTVGVPLPGLELSLAPDGEVLVRGGNVTPGYYRDDAATGDLVDDSGWMHSGDIGRTDANGYLILIDRKKDLIITAGGKNVAPQAIEGRLREHEIISNAVVVGDRRPYLCALVTLDENGALRWARAHGIAGGVPDIAAHERTLEAIRSSIDAANSALSRAEGVKKFRVLDRDFAKELDEVTPTMKIKRDRITEAFADIIDEMYRRDSPEAAAVTARA